MKLLLACFKIDKTKTNRNIVGIIDRLDYVR